MFFLDFPQDQKPLVKREFYLDFLGKNTLQGKNIALLGPRKAGKTSITRDFIHALAKEKEVIPAYIDLSRTSTPPENFSIEFVGNVAFWYLGSVSKDYKKFLDLDYLLKKFADSESLGKINNELQKIKPDQRLMVESAFDFVEELSKKAGKKIVLCLDNFENILEMNNFKQIKDILSIINFSSENIVFFVTSSAIALMKNSLKDFEIEEIKNFTREETKKLAEIILGKTEKKIIDNIFDYSQGHAYVVERICQRYKELKDVRKSFLHELAVKDSPLYNHLNIEFSESLNRARGKSLLKLIIKVLADIKEAKLTEISKKIYRSAPVTKSLLERLILVDLITKQDGNYSITNSVLEKWVKLVFRGIDTEQASEEIFKKIEEVLNE